MGTYNDMSSATMMHTYSDNSRFEDAGGGADPRRWYGRLIRLIACAALAVWVTACESPQTAPQPVDDPELSIVMPVRQFTSDTAMTAEFEMLTSPRDLQSRVDLLWFYRGQFGNALAEREANKHVLWLIANQPRAAVLATPVAEISTVPSRAAFDFGKAAWQRQVEANPKDAVIAGHAGIFLARDEPELAVPLLEMAHKAQPQQPVWSKALAQALRVQALSSAGLVQQQLARQSVTMYEHAAAKTRSERERMILLSRAASVARRTGDDGSKAVSLATQAIMLADAFEPGSDRAGVEHNANVTVGLIALSSGKVDVARDMWLPLAAESVLNQPASLSDLDMSLAMELFNRGEKAAVLAYLEVCAKATQSGEARLWIEAIRRGDIPNMSSYLH